MLIRKWIASGHGPAMLVALLLSLIAGAPAAAVPQLSGRAPTLEQAPSQQAIFVKRAQSLQALRAPQPTPFAAIVPEEFGLALPILAPASVAGASQPKSARVAPTREPYQPRAPPAA